MSSELERRLEGLLAAAPEPVRGVGDEAMERALAALQPLVHARRGLRTAVLVFAATVVLLAVAAGSLAAAGALHVSFGTKARQRPTATTQLSLPKGTNGIAAVVGGRLWVVTKGGFRLQGLPVTAAALSPHALYLATGIGHSLVAMAPDGRRPWSYGVDGQVRAIAWAPDGLRIAYAVGRALHVIWGNGTHDVVIDRSVRPVRPSWRADSLALAYVGAGGKAIVYDLGHVSRRVLGSPSPVTHVAFAPAGRKLALATTRSAVVVRNGEARRIAAGSIAGIGWLGDRLVVDRRATTTRLEAIASDGGALLRALAGRAGVRLVLETGAGRRTVARLPPGAIVGDLAVR